MSKEHLYFQENHTWKHVPGEVKEWRYNVCETTNSCGSLTALVVIAEEWNDYKIYRKTILTDCIS